MDKEAVEHLYVCPAEGCSEHACTHFIPHKRYDGCDSKCVRLGRVNFCLTRAQYVHRKELLKTDKVRSSTNAVKKHEKY